MADVDALPPIPTKESKAIRNLRKGVAVMELCIFDDLHASQVTKFLASAEETHG